MAWHDGIWWPIYTLDWFSPKVSQHLFDPYSLTHVLHGLIFQLVLARIFSFPVGFLICVLIELCWEILENSELIMRRFRENSGTSSEYKGDSVQNILGDLLSCSAGYIIGTAFYTCGVPWASLVWIAVSEVGCAMYMRDNLVIVMINLVVRLEPLVAWQAGGLPKKSKEE
eukprot:GFUD01023114.1.p1 GENE.GFUD01023114.1~~GFUD01023114.1.p1  ORF type:complete len:170 (-),score=34.74 GFUD01023114.1:11-520(-)